MQSFYKVASGLCFYFKQKRYKRLKKLKPIDSDEEDDDRASVGGHSADEREALAHELFEDDDAEQPPVCLLEIMFLRFFYFFWKGEGGVWIISQPNKTVVASLCLKTCVKDFMFFSRELHLLLLLNLLLTSMLH